MELDEVADALYALPREEFIPAREERAKSAKAAGSPDLAKAIGRLRRPTVAAWLVNQLARAEPERLAELAELGETLREAHERLDGTALRDLSVRRRALVAGLTDAGAALGPPVTEATRRELEDTFTAALASPEAAHTLTQGRLTSPKDLTTPTWPTTPPRLRPREPGSTAPRVEAADTASRQPERTEPPAPATPAPDGPSPALLRARRELAELESRAADAQAQHTAAQADYERASTQETEAHRAVADRRAELIAAEQAERDARQHARAARRAQEDTERGLRDAHRRLAVLRERLTALGDTAQ